MKLTAPPSSDGLVQLKTLSIVSVRITSRRTIALEMFAILLSLIAYAVVMGFPLIQNAYRMGNGSSATPAEPHYFPAPLIDSDGDYQV